MKIAASTVSMDASRSYTEVDNNNTVWQQGTSDPVSSRETTIGPSGTVFRESLFTLIHSSYVTKQTAAPQVTSGNEVDTDLTELAGSSEDQTREQVLSALTRAISGTPVTVNRVFPGSRSQSANNFASLSTGSASLISSSVHVEEEAVYFQAGGAVQTEDGRSISFDMGLQMERREVSMQTSWGSGNFLIDPLVMSFDNNISIFDDTFFTFDLDGDGSEEELSCLAGGCGFLALDRDGDGTITDGLELFGPATDDGFGELAELDADGNSWIDENDPIFDELLVWMGAGGEDEELLTLREAGVGAISVAHLGTQFNLEDQEGGLQGVVQASGLFLMENGEPRSMQEIDLAVRDQQQEVRPVDGAEEEVTQSSTNMFISSSWSEEVQESIDNLREIISWQRLKMKMMLGQNLLRSQHEELVERLEHLSSGFMFSWSAEEES